jgi:hypothetical protein
VSIFSKICPRCAGENPLPESRCQCGFVFDASATTGSYKALEMVVQETEVYAEYLHVRMKQAMETAEVAIAERARAPGDPAKSRAADAANEEYLAAKAEYGQQMKMVAQARRDAMLMREKEPKAARQAQGVQAERRAKTKKQALTRNQAAISKQKMTKRPTKNGSATTTRKTATSRPVMPIPKQDIGQASPPSAMRQKMAKAANSTSERVRKTKSTIGHEVVAANRVLQEKSTATAAVNTKNPPVATAKAATPQFTAKQATKAQAAHKECPNCTAMVALEVDECKCGFGFASGAQKMDGVNLSEEDRALFSIFRPARTS